MISWLNSFIKTLNSSQIAAMSLSNNHQDERARKLKLKLQTIRRLSSLQRISATALGVFLVSHLAAPLISVVAPPGKSSDFANKTMVSSKQPITSFAFALLILPFVSLSQYLHRLLFLLQILSRTFFYQNSISEPLVWASLLTHAVSGIGKRLIQRFWRIESSQSSSNLEVNLNESSQRSLKDDVEARKEITSQKIRKGSNPTFSLHTVTGYLLIPFLTNHVFLNRIIPSRDTHPINNLSPSELDYSYVSYAFRTFPIKSSILYLGLIAPAVYHSVFGIQKLFNFKSPSWITNIRGKKDEVKDVEKSNSLSEKMKDLPSPLKDLERKRNQRNCLFLTGFLQALLLVGIVRICRETEPIPSYLAKRVSVVPK